MLSAVIVHFKTPNLKSCRYLTSHIQSNNNTFMSHSNYTVVIAPYFQVFEALKVSNKLSFCIPQGFCCVSRRNSVTARSYPTYGCVWTHTHYEA